MAGFGAKVRLTVDKSAEAKKEFNEQISGLIKQIKISNKFLVLQKDMDKVRKDMEVKLASAPIAIKTIDCSEAVDKFRTDMQSVINSLSVKNGVQITGLVDPSGTGTIQSQITNIAGEAANGQAEVDRLNAQLLVLKNIISSISHSYDTLLPGGKNAKQAAPQFEDIQNQYIKILNLIENVKHAQGVASKEEMDALIQEALLLRKKIDLIDESRQAAEAKAAKDKADKAAADAKKKADDKVKAANDAKAAAIEAQVEIDRMNGQLNNLKDIMRSISTAYKTLLPGGKNDKFAKEQLDEIQGDYTTLLHLIENVKHAQGVASKEDMDALIQEATLLRQRISLIEEARKASDAAAAEAKANAAEAKRNAKRDAAEKKRDAKRDAAEKKRNAERDAKAAERALRGAEKAAAAKAKAERNTGYDQLIKINNLLVTLKNNYSSWTGARYGKSKEAYADLANQIRNLEKLRQVVINAMTHANEEDPGVPAKGIGHFDDYFKKIKSAAAAAGEAIKAAGENAQSFGDHAGGLIKKFASWLTVSQVIMQVYQALRETVRVVSEVDAAMTELKKVTDETEETYNQFLDTVAVRAKRIGATISDTVNATALFARLGYDLEDAANLAEVATVYKNVGDGIESIDQASESIISTMKAFRIEAQDAMTVVDKFNIVGNKFAISSTGIGEALLNSASALYAAGNNLDESIALITAANEVIQNPERVGTALKTLSMYMRAAKTEAEEAGVSTDGMAASVSSLREEILQLTNQRVDIMLDESTFKSTVQILRELSGIWGELSDITRANITELIGGGVRNANIVATLINNFATVEKAMAESANSAGSAMAENEKYLDSIAGKLAEFKNSFQSLAITLLSSETVKDVIGLGTGLLNIIKHLAKVNEALGGIHSTLVILAGTIAIIKMDKILSFLADMPKKIGAIRAAVSGLSVLVGQFPKVMSAYIRSVKSGGSAVKGLSEAMSSLGITAGTTRLALGAVTAVIVAGIAAFKAYKRHQQEVRDRAVEAARAAEEASDRLFELASKEALLAEAVKSGTAAREELVSAQNELGRALRDEGIRVDALTDKYDNMTASIQANTLEALKNNEIILAGGANAASENLLDFAKPSFWEAGSNNIHSFTWDERDESATIKNQAAMEALMQAGWIRGAGPNEPKPYGPGGAVITLLDGENGEFKTDNIDGIINSYNRLFEMMETLRDTVGTDNGAYQTLFNLYSELTPLVTKYSDAVDALNKNLIQQLYIEGMVGNPVDGIPETQEEFDKFFNWFTLSITNAAKLENSAFAGTEDDVKRAINLFISSQPALAKFMGGVSDSVSGVGETVDRTKEETDEFLKVVNDLKGAYDILHKAEKEMAEAGSISASTLLSVMNSTEDYIKYIEVENGLIKLNSEAWKENAEAKILAMIAEDEARRAELQDLIAMPDNPGGGLITDSDNGEEDEADPNYYSGLYALKEKLDALNLTIEKRKAILDALRKDGTDDSSSAIDDQLKKMEDDLRKQIAFIEHQILVLEKTGGSKEAIIKKYKELQDLVHNQAEIYRGMGLGEDSEYIINLQKLWLGYADNISGVRDAILADIKAIAEATDKAIDNIQAMYNTLQKAADEYAESGGHISIDTFQEIIKMGPQYMQYLQDENGLLVINRDKINAVIRAKTEQLSVETALAYVDRLRLAINGESTESLDHLLYATTKTTDATWGLVYASLDFLDLTNKQREAAKHNIDSIRSITESALRGIGAVAGESGNSMKEMREGSEDLLKYVMDMLKSRIEEQIKAIEEEKSSYRELIELKKEALDTTKKEDDYEKNVAKQVKEISKLQARIDLLSLDDSREAEVERKRLQEEMEGLQESLADDQANHAIDAQKDALDQMADDYDDEKDEEIRALKDSISSKQKLYEMAIQYIRNNWSTLKNDLLQWNYDIGASFAEEIVSAWDKAMIAAQKYGSYLEALKQLQIGPFDKGGGNNGTIGGSSGPNSVVGETTDEEHIHAIIREMYANSQSWLVADRNKDSDKKARLDKRNLELGAMLSRYGVHAVRGFKGKDDGVWFVDDIGGEKLYEKYRRYIYHAGGIAGDKPTLKQNEIMAVLEKGEAVLDKRKEMALCKLVDFVNLLAGKIGSAVQIADVSQVFQGMLSGFIDPPNIPVTNVGSIHFGDVNIYGPNDDTAKRHMEINRRFTNDVLKQLNIKR